MRAHRHALATMIACLVLAAAACDSGSVTRAAPGPARAPGSVVLLDSSGVLAALSAGSLGPQWRVDLGVRDRSAHFGRYPRHALAVDARHRVYVVAPPWMFVVDGATGQVRAAVTLPSGVDWTAPTVVDDGVYLAGADRSGAPVVALVDTTTQHVTDTATVRPAGGRVWTVYATAAYASGSRLAISYNGSGPTGMDLLDLGMLQPVPCPDAAPGAECSVQADGDVAAYPGGLIATTGSGDLLLFDATGRLTGRLATNLAGDHLMQTAVDPLARVAYLLGACGFAGGLARVALPGGRANLLAARSAGAPARVCGDRVLVAPGGTVLTVMSGTGVAVVDAASGGTLIRRAAKVPLIDAVALS